MAASEANAVTSITQKNIQVPTTGTLAPGDFLTDGTNIWFGMDLYDGTTWATFNADSGLNTHVVNSVAVTGTFWQTTQPISAASLPLPSGAATSALQTTGNTALTTINTTLGSPMQNSGGTVTATQATGSNLHVQVDNTNANGQALMAASAPVVIASDQSAVATKAASGAFVAGSITDLAHGQGTMAASVPVAIASNQSAVPVSAASLPLPSGAATSALQTTINTTLGTPMQQTGGTVTLNQGGSVLSAANGLPTAPSPYPAGSTPITASATGTTGATTATLTAVSGHTTYICGFSIRANATAAATGNATVTGTISGTLNFTQWTAPNASGVGVTEIPFAPCVPASAVTTNIAVVSAAPGTGGVVSVTAWGYSI